MSDVSLRNEPGDRWVVVVRVYAADGKPVEERVLARYEWPNGSQGPLVRSQ